MRRPILQVALDFMNLHRALKVAEEAVAGGADWLEAGTPLIKAEGLDAVRALKRQFPKYTIVADMKTVDVGRLEVEMAAKAGADVVVVLAISDEATIREAVRKAEEVGKEVLVDTLGIRDAASRLRDVMELGVHRVCLHRGVDEGIFQDYELLDELRELDIRIGVAGGINASTIGEVARRADFVMVGRAITRADDPRSAAGEILRAAGVL